MKRFWFLVFLNYESFVINIQKIWTFFFLFLSVLWYISWGIVVCVFLGFVLPFFVIQSKIQYFSWFAPGGHESSQCFFSLFNSLEISLAVQFLFASLAARSLFDPCDFFPEDVSPLAQACDFFLLGGNLLVTLLTGG